MGEEWKRSSDCARAQHHVSRSSAVAARTPLHAALRATDDRTEQWSVIARTACGNGGKTSPERTIVQTPAVTIGRG